MVHLNNFKVRAKRSSVALNNGKDTYNGNDNGKREANKIKSKNSLTREGTYKSKIFWVGRLTILSKLLKALSCEHQQPMTNLDNFVFLPPFPS